MPDWKEYSIQKDYSVPKSFFGDLKSYPINLESLTVFVPLTDDLQYYYIMHFQKST